MSAARNEPWFSATELSDTAEGDRGLAARALSAAPGFGTLHYTNVPGVRRYRSHYALSPVRADLAQLRRNSGRSRRCYNQGLPCGQSWIAVSQAHDLNAANLPFASGIIPDLTAWLREHAGLAQASHTARNGVDNGAWLTGGDQYLGAFRLATPSLPRRQRQPGSSASTIFRTASSHSHTVHGFR